MHYTIPVLNEGEHYAGIIVVKGAPTHHLVVLPEELTAVSWDKSMAWANKRGGDLPTLPEQALCFANARELFEHHWYWSNAQYATDAGFAWFQDFGNGDQYDSLKGTECRARAVRRVAI